MRRHQNIASIEILRNGAVWNSASKARDRGAMSLGDYQLRLSPEIPRPDEQEMAAGIGPEPDCCLRKHLGAVPGAEGPDEADDSLTGQPQL